MTQKTVTITQVYKVTRTITLELGDETLNEAIDKLSSGETDVPSFDNPGWTSKWDLQNEEYE